MTTNTGVNEYSMALSHSEAVMAIRTSGMDNTIKLEGEPGIGKSAILTTLEHQMGGAYDYIYVNVPDKDIPDIALSMPDHTTMTTRPFVNQLWLGSNPDKPKIIMLDEVDKATEYVKLILNRLVHEHVVGEYKLPPGSIVFATTNFVTDGVGDRANAHTASRFTTKPIRKPTSTEWVSWAADNGIAPLITTWAEQNPAIFNSYRDTEFNEREHKDGNGVFHYIFHPQHNNKLYVCPRTLEKASHLVNKMDLLGEALLTKLLIGTVGMKAAMDMTTMFAFGAELPHPKDIEVDPMNARLPKSASARLMMVFKSVQYITAANVDAYATYFKRMPMEIIATWMKTGIGSEKTKTVMCQNQQVREYAISNSWVL